jgi:hypothetical protein
MTAKLMAILGAGAVGLAGTVAAVIIHVNSVKAQATANATTTLGMDLIQAQAGLEGWQQEAVNGNLSSADYRTAFSDYLGGVSTHLSADSQGL